MDIAFLYAKKRKFSKVLTYLRSRGRCYQNGVIVGFTVNSIRVSSADSWLLGAYQLRIGVQPTTLLPDRHHNIAVDERYN